MRATIVACAFLVWACAIVSEGQILLRYNLTTYRDRAPAVIRMSNLPVVWWETPGASNGSLLTGGWSVVPRIKSGYRAKRMRVDFSSCSLGTSNKIIIFPYATYTFAVNFSDQFTNLPSYITEVTSEKIPGGVGSFTLENAGEAFVAFRCCVLIQYDQNSKKYSLQQENVTCTITVTPDESELVMVPSMILFTGIIVVLGVPAVAVFLIGCCVRPRSGQKRSDPKFQRKSGVVLCSTFWVSFLAALLAFIFGFLFRM